MDDNFTRKIIETAIADYLKKHGKDPKCMACVENKDRGNQKLCPAHELEMQLADWERSGDRLTELYFEILKG